jgi:hypothetical protein
MKETKTITPIACHSFESALDHAKRFSHHDGLGIEPQFMYVIQRGGQFWCDSSRRIGTNERLICTVLHRHTKPFIDKIFVNDMANGYFIKHPENGFIYAIFESRKLGSFNNEYVIIHFDHTRFTQLKHGNPNREWRRWEHVSGFVKARIHDYNRNLGI